MFCGSPKFQFQVLLNEPVLVFKKVIFGSNIEVGCGVGLKSACGEGNTVTIAVVVDLQPFPSVRVILTLYEPWPIKQFWGAELVDICPSSKFQLYKPIVVVVLEKFTHKGAQPEIANGEIEICGEELTVIVAVAIFMQPFPSVPITV